MSRRGQITMSAEELAGFLASERVVVLASNGRDGYPHLMPLWYVVRDGDLWSWTYGTSQKVRNLERDARCTLQVEAGEQYQELRGVMIKARAQIHRDLETVAALGAEIAARYSGVAATDDMRQALLKQASKRVGLQFVPVETATWDHGKLGGVY